MGKSKRVISHKDFTRDLGRGALGEDITEAFFEKEFDLIAKNVSKRNPDYDMVISEITPSLAKKKGVVPAKMLRKIFKDSLGITKKKEITVEVKFDEAAARYKNFFLEIFFDVETGSPGTIFKCKADIFVWIVPAKRKFKLFLFKRPEFLAWFFGHVFTSTKKFKYKTPGISPYARGIAVPIKDAAASPACIGVFEYKI